MKKFLNLKYAHTFILVLLCSLISFTFTACSNDEPEPETGKKDFLVGTWKYQFYDDGFVYYTFNENGTGRVFEKDGGDIDQDDTFTYIHYPIEQRIKVFWYDDYENISYEKISNTRIIVYNFSDDVEIWEKQ